MVKFIKIGDKTIPYINDLTIEVPRHPDGSITFNYNELYCSLVEGEQVGNIEINGVLYDMGIVTKNDGKEVVIEFYK